MEKSRFDIISDLFKLSHMVGDSLKRMESLADNGSGNKIEICRNIKYSLKTMPFLLDSIREYIAEHEDRELARKFVELYADTKRLHELCSKHTDLNKAAFRTGMAYMSMEVIGQYFFPETEAQKVTAEILPNPMTRTEATDYIDTIRAAIRKCAENPDGNRGKEMYTLLFGMDKAKIQSVKEYIVNANDKDLAQLFTEYFAEAVHLSLLPQKSDVKAQSAGIKMFHIALTMGYIKRNVLRESTTKTAPSCIAETASDFIATDMMQGKAFSNNGTSPGFTPVSFPYHFYRSKRGRQGKAVTGRQRCFRQGFSLCRDACGLFYGICQLRERQDALRRYLAIQSLF